MENYIATLPAGHSVVQHQQWNVPAEKHPQKEPRKPGD